MALVVPNVGETEMLKRILNIEASTDVSIRLYVNSGLTIDDDVVLSSFTEATVETAGYERQSIADTDWTVSTDGGTGVTTAVGVEQTFDFISTGSARNIYGYYVTEDTAAPGDAPTTLLWAEEFDSAPWVFPAAGGSIKIVPKIELA